MQSIEFPEWRILGESRAGLQSWIRLHPPGLAFDVGRGHEALEGVGDLFLSHGHLDHVLGLPLVLSFRSRKGDETRIFAPQPLVKDLEAFIQAASRLEGRPYRYELKGLEPGEVIDLKTGYRVEAFKTDHGVPSLGFHVKRIVRRLDSRYRGLEGSELARLRAQGQPIEVEREIIYCSYTGDTTAKVFDWEPRLYESATLILECTFLEEGREEDASRYGHLHVEDLLDRAECFNNESIVLVHLSRRHSHAELRQIIASQAPDLTDRIFILGEES